MGAGFGDQVDIKTTKIRHIRVSIPRFASMSVLNVNVLNTNTNLDYDIYSPDVFGGVLYLGGWLTSADIGPDRLYQSTPAADAPTAIIWSGTVPYGQYHLNDPSVVREADGTLAMFMTALPNAYGYNTGMLSHNVTGLATSSDGGQTWTWQGVVIGQWNGIDSTGAWSPSAVVNATGIGVWYSTGWTDVATGAIQPIRILHSQMDPSGAHVISTSECINALTYAAITGENVDVKQAADGTYWMVANDYSSADGSAGKIVLYESHDGVFWTPWSTQGATLLSPSGNTVLMTPTITGISGNVLSLMYAEQITPSATIEDSMTIELSDQPAVARFAETTTFNGALTSTLDVAGESYSGPVNYLQSQFIYAGTDSIDLTALVPNAFLHSGAGEDALAAISGRNVLDGGTGSNFMTGGTGTDVFFVVASGGTDTWSTVNGFKSGDEVTMWDVTPAMTDMGWNASQGAADARGATLHIAEGTGHWASLTLAGFSVGQAAALSVTFGTVGGRAYLHLAA